MNQVYPLKIDIFPHIIPPKYKDRRLKSLTTPDPAVEASLAAVPSIHDLELRFRIMDRYEPLVQVLTLVAPACWEIYDAKKSVDLAKLVNDEMAELVLKYPDRFVAAAATLPMNDIDAALKEIDRAILELNLRGIHILIDKKPLDSPEFMPIYEKMSQYNLPIWFHPPGRREASPSFPADPGTKYPLGNVIWGAFGWPYETTVAMTRLVFSGVFDKYPNLKFITHHCGGMIPYFWQRIVQFAVQQQLLSSDEKRKHAQGLTRPVDEYLRMFFYNDTAIYGNPPGLMCGYEFFGADHLLFGTDMPLGDTQHGDRNTRETINAIEQMDISEVERKRIFQDNARNLLRLPI